MPSARPSAMTASAFTARPMRGVQSKDAGNIRIEGLFFEQQTRGFGFSNQLSKSTTMRVGLSAQSYPFPAPTGIADIRLRLPGDKALVSVTSFFGPYSASYGGQADLELPIISKKLGAVFSVAGAIGNWMAMVVFVTWISRACCTGRRNPTRKLLRFIREAKPRTERSRPLLSLQGARSCRRNRQEQLFRTGFCPRKTQNPDEYWADRPQLGVQ